MAVRPSTTGPSRAATSSGNRAATSRGSRESVAPPAKSLLSDTRVTLASAGVACAQQRVDERLLHRPVVDGGEGRAGGDEGGDRDQRDAPGRGGGPTPNATRGARATTRAIARNASPSWPPLSSPCGAGRISVVRPCGWDDRTGLPPDRPEGHMLARVPDRSAPDRSACTYSVVIPVYNSQDVVGSTVEPRRRGLRVRRPALPGGPGQRRQPRRQLGRHRRPRAPLTARRRPRPAPQLRPAPRQPRRPPRVHGRLRDHHGRRPAEPARPAAPAHRQGAGGPRRRLRPLRAQAGARLPPARQQG